MFINKNLPELSVQHYWRLLVDRPVQTQIGPTWREQNEPGYLKSMFTGFEFMLKTLYEPLTVDSHEHLHNAAVSHTQYLQKFDTADGIHTQLVDFPQGYRDNDYVEFGLVAEGPGQNISLAGLRELLEKMARGDSYFFIQADIDTIASSETLTLPISDETVSKVFEKLKATPCKISIKPCSLAKIKQRVQAEIKAYYTAIAIAKDDDSKLRAIATLIRDLEIAHPFPDGNSRTHAILTLNKLLRQNGFSYVILECRDRFDAYSIDELVVEIKQGWQNFQDVQARQQELAGSPGRLYLEGNETLAKQLILEACSSIPVWSALPEGKRLGVIDKLKVCLIQYKKAIDNKEFSKIRKAIIEIVVNAIGEIPGRAHVVPVYDINLNSISSLQLHYLLQPAGFAETLYRMFLGVTMFLSGQEGVSASAEIDFTHFIADSISISNALNSAMHRKYQTRKALLATGWERGPNKEIAQTWINDFGYARKLLPVLHLAILKKELTNVLSNCSPQKASSLIMLIFVLNQQFLTNEFMLSKDNHEAREDLKQELYQATLAAWQNLTDEELTSNPVQAICAKALSCNSASADTNLASMLGQMQSAAITNSNLAFIISFTEALSLDTQMDFDAAIQPLCTDMSVQWQGFVRDIYQAQIKHAYKAELK